MFIQMYILNEIHSLYNIIDSLLDDIVDSTEVGKS